MQEASDQICRTCHGLSNAVYRLSLSFLVFEFSGGGGAVILPGRAKVAQTPGRARVKVPTDVLTQTKAKVRFFLEVNADHHHKVQRA